MKWVESQPMIHVARMSNKRADFRAAMRFPGKLTKFVTAYDEDDNVVELDSANIHHIDIDDYDCVSHKVLKTYGYSLEEIEMIKNKV